VPSGRPCPVSYMVKTRSLYSPGLESVPGRDGQTDRQTDRIAIANTRSAVPGGTAERALKVYIFLQNVCENVF